MTGGPVLDRAGANRAHGGAGAWQVLGLPRACVFNELGRRWSF